MPVVTHVMDSIVYPVIVLNLAAIASVVGVVMSNRATPAVSVPKRDSTSMFSTGTKSLSPPS